MIIEHAATKNFLYSDQIVYGNQFGNECEVSCMKAAVKHKDQVLHGEGIGKKVINFQNKSCDARNTWQILTASEPSAAEPLASPDALQYDGATLVSDLRGSLAKKGSMAVRALIHTFNRFDANADR